jgi:hypothetical protein
MMRPARVCSSRSAGVLCIRGDPASVNHQVAGSNPLGRTILQWSTAMTNNSRHVRLLPPRKRCFALFNKGFRAFCRV